MSTYTNGHTATATPPPIAKAQFEMNVPMRVQLKFAKGLLCAAANSKFPEAGDQVMFTLVDERKLYVPAYVADRMDTLGGQDFIITKKQALASRKITWVVNRAATFDASVHAAVAAIAPAPVVPAYDDGEYNTWGSHHPHPRKALKRAL